MYNLYTVSVVIPNYNRAILLKEAIESVLNQSHDIHEIIICDDGSTDNSLDVVLSFNNSKIIWLNGIHTGRPAGPRNRGIKYATGNWIAFLDSDDKWDKNKISEQIEVIQNEKSFAICTNAHILGNLTRKLYFDLNTISTNISFNNLLNNNPIICSSVLIKKSILYEIGFFNENIKLRAIEDYELWLRISRFYNWKYIDKPLTIYKDDTTNSIRKEENFKYFNQKLLIYNFYLKWSFLKLNRFSFLLIIRYLKLFLNSYRFKNLK